MSNYLKFDAESILTTLKLNIQNSEKYSDQLFEGSNLSIILETLSLMFENLTYITNNEATQASFGDTTIYEAINKLVKKLAYNPRGPISASTSTTTFGIEDGASPISGSSNSTKIFSKYIRFQPPIGKEIDSNGNNIFYSLVEDYTMIYDADDADEATFTNLDGTLFYNGVWSKYDTEFITSGESNETYDLILNQEDIPVSDLKIFAYYTLNNAVYEYKAVRNLFDYSPTDKVFEVRVNEDKELNVRFGDGISGALLPTNATLQFVYLKSNGNDGVIGKELINIPKQSTLSFAIEGFSNAEVKTLLGIDSSDKSYIVNEDAFNEQKIFATIDTASTSFEVMETVDEIKENAPTNFRSGGRLLTANDFNSYIVQYFSDAVHDNKIMNNWEYMSSFHKWLYDNNVLVPQIASFGYKFADSCDFNNIYVWLQSNSSTSNVSKFVKDRMDDSMKPIKVLTSEVVFLDSIKTFIYPYVGDIPVDIDVNENWPDADNTIIRINRDPNSLISAESIRSKAISIFTNYFSYKNNTLGQAVDASELYSSLLAVNGITKVQTVKDDVEVDGISLARWTDLIVNGSDFITFTGSSKLQPFQFPVFYNIDDIINKLEIVDSNNSSGGVEY